MNTIYPGDLIWLSPHSVGYVANITFEEQKDNKYVIAIRDYNKMICISSLIGYEDAVYSNIFRYDK